MFARLPTSMLVMGSLLPATPAFAHAELQQAVPPVSGTVKQAPTQLRLTFSEGIEAKFSSVVLTSAKGKSIAVGSVSVGPPDASVVTVTIRAPLQPGTYTVKWRATSVDSHKTQGSYRFTVAP